MTMDFVYFLGRFHVLAVHLPIGILLLAVLLEVLVRQPKFKALESCLPLVWLVGAIAAVATVVLGYLHAAEAGFDGPAINVHRWSATLLAVFAFAAWAWRTEAPKSFARAWLVPVVGTTVLLFTTGHYGGDLTHGSSYLVQYAPVFLQKLAGVPDELLSRPPVKDLASADIYLDVVAPALRNRCIGCHNDKKRRGSLSLASHKKILQGGKDGPVVVAGNSAKSDLIRRITLSHDHADFMPKDGKTPLTPQETAAIEWWVAVGAPKTGTLASLKASAEIQATIAGALGLQANAPERKEKRTGVSQANSVAGGRESK